MDQCVIGQQPHNYLINKDLFKPPGFMPIVPIKMSQSPPSLFQDHMSKIEWEYDLVERPLF
jgi:hypothetical protein